MSGRQEAVDEGRQDVGEGRLMRIGRSSQIMKIGPFGRMRGRLCLQFLHVLEHIAQARISFPSIMDSSSPS
jgi:hypothetical protein